MGFRAPNLVDELSKVLTKQGYLYCKATTTPKQRDSVQELLSKWLGATEVLYWMEQPLIATEQPKPIITGLLTLSNLQRGTALPRNYWGKQIIISHISIEQVELKVAGEQILAHLRLGIVY
jgi:hypothetical protein